MIVTAEAAACCWQVLADPTATQDEYDAAGMALNAYRFRAHIDNHIATVLIGYATRQQRVNRYGK